MASGAAHKLSRDGKVPVMIVGGDGRPQWSDLWTGLPYIVKRSYGKPVLRMVNGGGIRPYILKKTPERWVWKPYKPIPAEIVFTKAELAFAEPYRGMVMIEPNVKNIGHENKRWDDRKWSEINDRAADAELRIVQCVSGDLTLRNATHIRAPTFRHASAVLSVCKAFIGTEGGLGHAAAAVGTPAVVIYGGFISPKVTGYDLHRNLYTGGPGLGCGMRTNCAHCRKAMEAIAVGEVFENLLTLLGNPRNA